MRPVLPLLLAAAVLAGAGGCGTGRAEVAQVDPPAAGDLGGSGGTRLTIEVRPAPGARSTTYTLRCDPPAGSHPRADAACRALDRLAEPFAPVPRDTACAEIYGGPQTATVTGTFRGAPVHASFDRSNGCESARWDRHAALLGNQGGAV